MMKHQNATERFARHALETSYAAFPQTAINDAKTFILDSIGVGVAGSKAALAENVINAAKNWGDAGQNNGAHVWGSGTILPASSVAFVNGFQIHCQEYDCVHEPAVVHPMATIFAALMAETEQQNNVTGVDLIAAIIVAIDVAAGLGVAVNSPIRFFRPATAGIFGATLGIARLRQFDLETAMNALGYALAHCSGTMQAHVEGKPALPVQIGNAARGAILACDMAASGLPGPHDVLEGPFGYLSLYEEEWDITAVLDSLGSTWRVSEVSHKPFPTGRAAQGGIMAVLKLRDQGVTEENLEKLELIAPPLIKRLVGRPIMDGMPVNYARLCFGFSGAVALLNGAVGLNAFDSEHLSNPDILTLGKKIFVHDSGVSDPAAFTPQTAKAILKNGEEKTVTITALYGSPDAPLDRDAQLNKFRTCMKSGLSEKVDEITQKLINLTDTIETIPNASVLAKLAAGIVD